MKYRQAKRQWMEEQIAAFMLWGLDGTYLELQEIIRTIPSILKDYWKIVNHLSEWLVDQCINIGESLREMLK